MSYLGIDYSSKAIDAVILDDDTDHATHHRHSLIALPGQPTDGLHAARRLRGSFLTRTWFEDHGIVLVGIELPFGKPNALTPLMRIQGAIAVLIPPEYPIVEFHPATWLKACTQCVTVPQRSADRKTLANEFAAARGFRTRNHNASDAYGIAFATRLHDHGMQAANPGRTTERSAA